jgi:hypothetical protein
VSASLGELGFIASLTGSNPSVLALNKRVGNLSAECITKTIEENFERWFENSNADPKQVESALSLFVSSYGHGIEASWRTLTQELIKAAETLKKGLAIIDDLPTLTWWAGLRQGEGPDFVTFSSMLDRVFNPRDGEILGERGSVWWSSPTGAPVTFPQEAINEMGEIKFLDDHWVPGNGDRVRDVRCPRNPKIYRVLCEGDWTSLVDSYPIATNAPDSADWLPLNTPVFIPNWTEVAREWDCVELSVKAWLRISYVSMRTPSSLTTHLAGWHPGSMVWLNGFQ